MRDLGNDERAVLLYEEAVGLSRAEGDPLLLAHTVRHLGDLHRRADRLTQADTCYREALALYRSADAADAGDVANALRPAALLKERQGDPDAARALWSEAKTLYAAAGIQQGVDECDRHLALSGNNILD
jgi:tetratricopeptide (TPR) repeat protein